MSPTETPVKTIYKTIYKKGFQMQEMYFAFEGTLDRAVIAAKNYLAKRHLKHIHTFEFLTNLDDWDSNGHLEEIDPTT